MTSAMHPRHLAVELVAAADDTAAGGEPDSNFLRNAGGSSCHEAGEHDCAAVCDTDCPPHNEGPGPDGSGKFTLPRAGGQALVTWSAARGHVSAAQYIEAIAAAARDGRMPFDLARILVARASIESLDAALRANGAPVIPVQYHGEAPPDGSAYRLQLDDAATPVPPEHMRASILQAVLRTGPGALPLLPYAFDSLWPAQRIATPEAPGSEEREAVSASDDEIVHALRFLLQGVVEDAHIGPWIDLAHDSLERVWPRLHDSPHPGARDQQVVPAPLDGRPHDVAEHSIQEVPRERAVGRWRRIPRLVRMIAVLAINASLVIKIVMPIVVLVISFLITFYLQCSDYDF